MSEKLIINKGTGRVRLTPVFDVNSYTTWSITTKITAETLTNCNLICNMDKYNTIIYSYNLELTSTGLLKLSLSSNGTAWDICSGKLSEQVLDANETYYVRLSREGNFYFVYVNTDGTTYTNPVITVTDTHNCYTAANSQVILINKFNGSCNLDATSISADGDELFGVIDGYINYGCTISSGIATGFSNNNYLVCNGQNLQSGYKLITRVKTNTLNLQQYLFDNGTNGLYISGSQNKFVFKLDDNNIIYSRNTIIANQYYWLGYEFDGTDKHRLYYMLDNGIYSNYAELPDFEDSNCKLAWSRFDNYEITSNTNLFKALIYIGANTDITNLKPLNGFIDLNNTYLSCNTVTYNVSKDDKLPVTGTVILDSDETVVVTDNDMINLYTVSISAVNQVGETINLSAANIVYNITNNQNNYYVKPTAANNLIKVPAGSNVTYTVYVDNYNSYTMTLNNITENKTENIVLQGVNKTFILTATPDTATIALTVNGVTYTETGSITKTLQYRDQYTYNVSLTNYVTQTGNGTITADFSTAITLQQEIVLVALWASSDYIVNNGTLVATDMTRSEGIFLSTDANIETTHLTESTNLNANGLYILNGRLYFKTNTAQGTDTSLGTQVPLNNINSGLYANDWNFINIAGSRVIRDNKIYKLSPESASNLGDRRVGAATLYNDKQLWKSCTTTFALNTSNSLYFINDRQETAPSNITPTKIADNVTLYAGDPGVAYSHRYQGYYVDNSGLHCYNGSTDTIIDANTDWTYLTATLGICDSKLYAIYPTGVTLLDSDNWTEVAVGTVNSETSSGWAGDTFGIKNGNVVKLTLSGALTSPTATITNVDTSGNCSNISSGRLEFDSNHINYAKPENIFYIKNGNLFMIRLNPQNVCDVKQLTTISGVSADQYSFLEVKGYSGWSFWFDGGIDSEYIAFALAVKK